jgi:hypothetical protein
MHQSQEGRGHRAEGCTRLPSTYTRSLTNWAFSPLALAATNKGHKAAWEASSSGLRTSKTP